MASVIGGAVGVVIFGPVGAVLGALAPPVWMRLRQRPAASPPLALILLLLLVQLRSGLSVLAALIEVSDAVPEYRNLRTVARVARVSGLVTAMSHADDDLRPLVAQLARAQRSGASLSGSVRRMLEERLAADRASRIARARTLPVKLMIPVTLLMLPGLILLLYAPSLLAMFEDLIGIF
jgi:hypothetical protein